MSKKKSKKPIYVRTWVPNYAVGRMKAVDKEGDIAYSPWVIGSKCEEMLRDDWLSLVVNCFMDRPGAHTPNDLYDYFDWLGYEVFIMGGDPGIFVVDV